MDGNKRVSLLACAAFLDLNGYRLLIDDEAVPAVLDVAKAEMGLERFTAWVKGKSTKRKSRIRRKVSR